MDTLSCRRTSSSVKMLTSSPLSSFKTLLRASLSLFLSSVKHGSQSDKRCLCYLRTPCSLVPDSIYHRLSWCTLISLVPSQFFLYFILCFWKIFFTLCLYFSFPSLMALQLFLHCLCCNCGKKDEKEVWQLETDNSPVDGADNSKKNRHILELRVIHFVTKWERNIIKS